MKLVCVVEMVGFQFPTTLVWATSPVPAEGRGTRLEWHLVAPASCGRRPCASLTATEMASPTALSWAIPAVSGRRARPPTQPLESPTQASPAPRRPALRVRMPQQQPAVQRSPSLPWLPVPLLSSQWPAVFEKDLRAHWSQRLRVR